MEIMEQLSKVQQVQDLVDELNKYSYEYYVLNKPTISDYEFDMRLKELENLEKETGIILPDSPTHRVGSDIQTGFKSVTRTNIMGSIQNTYKYNELTDWADSVTGHTLILEPKFDGLSCSLIYKDGLLVQASTRGNGYKGDDITENVKTIKCIPLRLQEIGLEDDLPETVEIRGEVLLPKSEFARINKERESTGEKPFANERNAASGSLKQLNVKVTAERNLIFRVYSATTSDQEFNNLYLQSQSSCLTFAECVGFPVTDHWTCTSEDLINNVKRFETDYLKKQDFCMDGCVIKVDSLSEQKSLGYVNKYPKWARAFKFKQDPTSTKLTDIIWQISRSGKLAPVGILDPVSVDGTTISNVTLNNIDFIREMDIKLGSYLFISRGGAVIPKVDGVDYEKNVLNNVELTDIDEPKICPYCGSTVEHQVINNGEDTGTHIFCTNEKCEERQLMKLTYFVSKNCLNIKGLAEKTLRKLFERGAVKVWSDLYRMTPQDFIDFGIGSGIAYKIFDELEKSKSVVKAENVLSALGIPMIGQVTSKKILEEFGSIMTLHNKIVEDSYTMYETISKLDGVGSAAAKCLVEYFANNIDELSNVYKYLQYEYKDDNVKVGNQLDGMVCMATGTLENFSRDEIKVSMISHGAKYASGVTGKLDFILVGSAPGMNKIQKAEQLGIKMITEKQYLEMIK